MKEILSEKKQNLPRTPLRDLRYSVWTVTVTVTVLVVVAVCRLRPTHLSQDARLSHHLRCVTHTAGQAVSGGQDGVHLVHLSTTNPSSITQTDNTTSDCIRMIILRYADTYPTLAHNLNVSPIAKN